MIIWALPLAGVIIFEIVADVFAKEYSLKGGWLWFGAIASYVIATSFWLYAIKNGSGLARGVNIFSVSTAIIATVIGAYFYHEELKNFQLFGILLGIISLSLIFWE